MPALTLPDFVNKWRSSGLTERAGAQMHFLELCDALGEPHPASEDFSGATYTFEKGGTTIEGKQGFATSGSAVALVGSTRASTRTLMSRISNSSNIVRTWKIRRSLWCVTLSCSRFIPT